MKLVKSNSNIIKLAEMKEGQIAEMLIWGNNIVDRTIVLRYKNDLISLTNSEESWKNCFEGIIEKEINCYIRILQPGELLEID